MDSACPPDTGLVPTGGPEDEEAVNAGQDRAGLLITWNCVSAVPLEAIRGHQTPELGLAVAVSHRTWTAETKLVLSARVVMYA